MLIEDLNKEPWHVGAVNDAMEELKRLIIKDTEMLAMEANDWLKDPRRLQMIEGEAYYRNQTAILEKTQEITWKSNLKLQHDYTKKLVDQKIGYLLSKVPSISTDKKEYNEIIQETFDSGMLRKIRNIGKEAINKGIAYWYPYVNEKGDLAFSKFPSEQVLPFWGDNEHMEVTSFLRVFAQSKYMNRKKITETKVEYYHEKGIKFFTLKGGQLEPDVPAGVEQNYHFLINDKPYLWEKIPLIHFKYNEEEQPLLNSIKSLVDNYDKQASVNADVLADIPKFIYKLVNYGGVDLEEFLNDLNKYMAVKLDKDGDVGKLQAEVATDAVEKELSRTRDAIYEFGRGVDIKDSDFGNASGKSMRHRYGDLDMDSNVLESEMQSSLQHVLYFLNAYLSFTGQGDYTEEKVTFTFNRDIIINESEAIENAEKSVGILDDKTVRENHPWWTEEVETRLEEQKKEEQQAEEEYRKAFRKAPEDDVIVDE